jgi:hypothetical protein
MKDDLLNGNANLVKLRDSIASGEAKVNKLEMDIMGLKS